MQPPVDQLRALAAIADHGSFEAAARVLHVTPSAISQRIRALESTAGRVLLLRTSPCRPTPAGESLVRLARQTALLWSEAAEELDAGAAGVRDLAVAVNADSLATWWRPVLGAVADWDRVALHLHVRDQARSADLLRSGEVLAAVTSEPTAVQGCTAEALGVLRYRPAATPALAERWRRGRGQDWERMPVVVFDSHDRLQHDLLEGHGVALPPVVHRVPSSADFHEAVRRGLGWGAVPEPQLGPDLATGDLVALPGGHHVDVRLHWQRWRLDSPVLDRLTAAVRDAARAGLRR